jgi:amidase
LSEINFVSACEHARNLDAYWRLNGCVKGPLHGLPVSVMDRYNIEGLESACGFISWLGSSKKVEDEGTMVQKLRHLGAVVFCKTNVPMSMMVSVHTFAFHDGS